MSRKDELLLIFQEVQDVKKIIEPLIDDVVFLEQRLTELRGLPFIRINPNNSADQKATPAAKMYKEFLQQYNNCIKILCGVVGKNNVDDESPLRSFLKNVER